MQFHFSSQFEELAKELKLPPSDILMIGDGSGTSLSALSCGWHVSVYSFKHKKYKFFSGGATSGTNNYAELMPYIHVLWHMEASKKNKKPISVNIVSDSELTVKCGNREYTRKANLPLWSSIDWFEQNGYKISWFWIPRNSNLFSKRADKFSGIVRKVLDKHIEEVNNE